ncbi:MAG TPA: hypothetical protein VG897_01195, partial [Terriglobales bacterium]|nr:hypothetical protein [Terriglobales bacterium]
VIMCSGMGVPDYGQLLITMELVVLAVTNGPVRDVEMAELVIARCSPGAIGDADAGGFDRRLQLSQTSRIIRIVGGGLWAAMILAGMVVQNIKAFH